MCAPMYTRPITGVSYLLYTQGLMTIFFFLLFGVCISGIRPYGMYSQWWLLRSMSMFEYDNGILVCEKHRTPVQKDENGFWCVKCLKEAIKELKTQDED